jgi:hypothetical protein
VDGAVISVEVKSGWVTQAKSLKAFADKYHPPFNAVFIGRNLGIDPRLRKHYYPLYLASKFPLPHPRQEDASAPSAS